MIGYVKYFSYFPACPVPGRFKACRTTLYVGLTVLNVKLIKGIYEKIGYNGQSEGKWIICYSLRSFSID